MATHLEINHDSGPPVSAHWPLLQTGVGHSITAASAMNGSAFGLEIDEDVTVGFTLRKSVSAPASNEMRLRIYFDPNSVTRPSSGTYIMVEIQLFGTSGFWAFNDFVVNSSGDQWTYEPSVVNDAATLIPAGTHILTDGPNCCELVVVRSSGLGVNDGSYSVYLNGSLVHGPNSITLFTRFNNTTFIAASGLSAPPAGVSGQFYVDEILWDDDSTASLCIANSFTVAPMRKPADIDADGSNIYLGLLNSVGTPQLLKLDTGLATDPTSVFAPGAGDDIGVQCGRFNASIVYVAGAFDGTNVVERSADAGSTFTVIDDGTFGDVETFIIGPDSDDRVWIFDSDNGDIQETIDAGTNWTAINSSVTPVIRAVDRLGINVQEAVFGNALAASDNADYSVNSGGNLEDLVFPVEVDITGIVVN